MSFFSLDSKFMQAMGRICDLVILNVLFLVTCLPIFTIGAASAALYSVCFRIGTEREEGIFRSYFRAFRENFKQSTPVFLLLLVLGSVSGFNTVFFFSQTGALRYVGYLTTLLLVVVAMVYAYAFPLQSRFGNSFSGTLRNALLLSVGYLPRTLVLLVLNFTPLALLCGNLYLFLQLGFLWISLYFSAAAYISALLLRKVFAPYLQEENQP